MYDIVIFGATFAAAGFLCTYKGSVAVVERNTLCGYEFINALKKGRDFNEMPKTDMGVEFYKKLEEKGVFKGDFNLFDSSPVLYECFENKDVYLATEICDVEKCEDGFEIKIFNSGGFDVIKTKKIIDTTCHSDMILSKTLNALVKTDLPFEKSGVDDRKIFKCALDKNDNFITARTKLKEELEKEMIADHIASEFDVTTIENILKKGEITYIPSVSYKNPVLAFDAGCKLAKEEF